MRYDENKIEVALLLLDREDWHSFHATMLELSEVERAHVENQMDIEKDLNYAEFVKANTEVKADVDDEIPIY